LNTPVGAGILNLRFRAHALMAWLTANPLPGVTEFAGNAIAPNSLPFDSRQISQQQVMQALIAIFESQTSGDLLSWSPSTNWATLPLSWEDESTPLAI
jgi:urea carboxylase